MRRFRARHRHLAIIAVKYNERAVLSFSMGVWCAMLDFEIAWDPEDDPEGNVQHIAEHDLNVEDVEDVLRNRDNEAKVSRRSGRPIVFGWTATGRHIAVVWETICNDPRMVRVRTAYEVKPRRREP
jgi:hypothetical protein